MGGTYTDGRDLLSVVTTAIADGHITAIYNQLNPAKLAELPQRKPDQSRTSDSHLR